MKVILAGIILFFLVGCDAYKDNQYSCEVIAYRDMLQLQNNIFTSAHSKLKTINEKAYKNVSEHIDMQVAYNKLKIYVVENLYKLEGLESQYLSFDQKISKFLKGPRGYSEDQGYKLPYANLFSEDKTYASMRSHLIPLEQKYLLSIGWNEEESKAFSDARKLLMDLMSIDKTFEELNTLWSTPLTEVCPKS